MTIKSLLTYGSKVSNVELVYFAPISTIQNGGGNISSTYCVLARPDPWTDDNNPDEPRQDQKYLKEFMKNIFAAKLIRSSDICPVTERIDWVSGKYYDSYVDDEDMFELLPDDTFAKKFYVKNRYDQVFKCLWNKNKTVPSTSEPFFEPGNYSSNGIYQGDDGYKWKFMYTIDAGLKNKFMDKKWMPVQINMNTPNAFLSASGAGSVDVVNVISGGSGYDPATSPVSLYVDGDFTVQASGTVQVTNGVVTDVTITNSGKNYTYANAAIISTTGSGAVLSAPTSPVGGHGWDPMSELGVSRIMYSVEFSGDESGVIPTDINYHQIGLVELPSTIESSLKATPQVANGAIYSTTTNFVVATGLGAFSSDERIYQGSPDNPTFTATVLSFDTDTNVLRLINTTGTPTIVSPVYGRKTSTTRTLLSYDTPNYIPLSGYVAFIENRSGIQRSADGIEQFKFVLSY